MNPASEKGPSKFDWWKDWRRKSVAIIASGHSAKSVKFECLDGIPVLAIKENVFLYPKAEVVYGCDAPWWIYRDGLRDYKGLKICWEDRAKNYYPDLVQIEIDRKKDEILLDKPGLIGNGKNSGFQAINIAVQFGASRILLVGFDMTDGSPDHWYGRNTWNGANNPEPWRMGNWRSHIERAYGQLKEIGVELFNASSVSALKVIPKISLEEFVQHELYLDRV